jgi:hypothetical protein
MMQQSQPGCKLRQIPLRAVFLMVCHPTISVIGTATWRNDTPTPDGFDCIDASQIVLEDTIKVAPTYPSDDTNNDHN